jgi:cell division protein FtsL
MRERLQGSCRDDQKRIAAMGRYAQTREYDSDDLDYRGGYRSGRTAAGSRGHNRYNDYYYYGSEAPALVPDYEPEPYRERRSGHRSQYAGAQNPRERAKTQARPRHISFAAMAGFAVMIIALSAVLIGYVSLEYAVIHETRQVATLESQLSDLKTQNDQTLNEINSSISLDDIKYRAIKDLGMTYADKDQVVNYESDSSDYVHQVQEVDNSGSSK